MNTTTSSPRPICGWIGFFLGAASLIAAVTLFWAGPFSPQSSAGVSLGELTAEIGKSAVRNIFGMRQPAPEYVERTMDDYLEIGVAAIASLSIILAIAAYVRRERRRLAIGAGALGVFTIAFQFFVWYALALVFVLLVWAIFHGLGDTVSGIFD